MKCIRNLISSIESLAYFVAVWLGAMGLATKGDTSTCPYLKSTRHGWFFKASRLRIMRMFLVIGLALFLQFPLTLAAKPNIVLVFIDDMGWGDFSCFGNKDAQTPQIDRLAREGVRFEQL